MIFDKPHILCQKCRHFACKHFGYPGRDSSLPNCTVMSMVPRGISHNEIERCDCTVEAKDIK